MTEEITPYKKTAPDGLQKLREPFPEHQIGKLAKGSKAQTQCPPSEKKPCAICGGFHHPKMVHLDYVGHAALTDRLLDCDPFWAWEPLAYKDGLPAFDESGGLWIKLTICSVTRLGYGNAEPSQYKEVGAREKEVIGDALRNAAMRFGAALELWHKGVLHEIEEDPEKPDKKDEKPSPKIISEAQGKRMFALITKHKVNIEKLKEHLLEKYKISSSKEVTVDKYDNIIKWIEEYKQEDPPLGIECYKLNSERVPLMVCSTCTDSDKCQNYTDYMK